MTNIQEMPTDDVIERAKARIEKMKQAAEELTEELSLPSETKYDVLSVMFDQEQAQYAEAKPLHHGVAVRQEVLGSQHLDAALGSTDLVVLYVTADQPT